MNGNKVNNSYKQQGFYLVSDAKDNSGNYIRKIISTGKDGFAEQEANAFGYSVRPVSAGKVSQVSFSHQEVVWDGVYVGQDSVQTVVVTNDGNSPAKITVTQTNAPFTVDAKCVGAFTIKPKERKDVLVLFKPTELENFESLLNIQYEIDNACTVCKIPLKGKGISQYEPTTETFTVNGVSFKMIGVEGGTFQMGATPEQESPYDGEKPVHSVTLSSYSIGETEVTQALWKAVMGNNPSYFRSYNGYTDDFQRPVESVSYSQCKAFINRLNQKTGKVFRMLTEAEWEYAARGGRLSKGYLYAGSDSSELVGWYNGTAGKMPHPVASLQPNELGLYDMSGNIEEWVSDYYGLYTEEPQTNPQGPASGTYHVSRGGNWDSAFRGCRVTYRYDAYDAASSHYGLRLAM